MKIYHYQESNFIFIKNSILFLSKIKFYLSQNSNFIFIEN